MKQWMILACAVVLTGACATRPNEDARHASPAPPAAATVPPAATPVVSANEPYDLQFLDTMRAHHEQAVTMAQMAVDKAAHPELKAMARKVIGSQRQEIGQMEAWRKAWYDDHPQAVNQQAMQTMGGAAHMDMGALQAASGNEFDRLFVSMMIPHHEGAVQMSREALDKAEHAEIKQLAERIIDAQQKEIAQMQKWQAAWGR